MSKNFIDMILLASLEFENLAKSDPKAKIRNRGDCIFPAEHSKVTDNKDHFPINSESQARSALSYANHFSEAPPWYSGSLESLVNAVARKVHDKYSEINITEKSTKPGKG